MTRRRIAFSRSAVGCWREGLATLSLAGMLAIAGAVRSQAPLLPDPPSEPAPSATTNDPVSQLVAEARASFARVKDYVGTLVKQEKVAGQLQPEQFISLRIRQQPFSVHLKWQGPKQYLGQEAAYVAGKNNGQMRARGAGLMGAVGFVTMEPNDPRALKQSRHAITESGIGNLIERVARYHDVARRLSGSHSRVTLREYQFQQRPCLGLESVYLVNNGQFYCYRTVVFFDKDLKLPVRCEAYDWPAAGGPPTGELLECYSYIDLKFNVGLTDAAFGF